MPLKESWILSYNDIFRLSCLDKKLVDSWNCLLKNKYNPWQKTLQRYSIRLCHISFNNHFCDMSLIMACAIFCSLIYAGCTSIQIYFLWRHHLPAHKSKTDQNSDFDYMCTRYNVFERFHLCFHAKTDAKLPTRSIYDRSCIVYLINILEIFYFGSCDSRDKNRFLKTLENDARVHITFDWLI